VPDSLTPGDGQDVLARYKEAREARDPDRMLALFTKDAEVRAHPFEAPLAGSLDIRRHWNTVAAEQATVEFDAERVWVAGRTVLSSWHEAYTRRATGERVRVRAFSTFELDDAGLVIRLRCWPTERVVAVDIPDLEADAAGRTREASHG
jgi:ketosteroid isomerase-like protein